MELREYLKSLPEFEGVNGRRVSSIVKKICTFFPQSVQSQSSGQTQSRTKSKIPRKPHEFQQSTTKSRRKTPKDLIMEKGTVQANPQE